MSDERKNTAEDKQRSLSELLTHKPGALLWQYCLPAVVGMVVMSLYNIVDRIFIGQVVGANAIAGLAITFPVMNLSAAIGVLIGVGASARTSILLGERNVQRATKVLGNALVLTLANATAYITLFAIFIDDILRAFGASDVTLPYAHDFMVWILPGMLMMNLAFSFNSIMRASGYPGRAMVTMLIGAGLNIVLAPIFIYFLDLGIKGAAIATDISMTISMLFVMAHFVSSRSHVHFTRGTYGLEKNIVWDIISIGAAPSIINAASCFINVILNHSLYRYGGDTAIAVAGIFTTYTSFIVTFMLGICQGMQPIIGYNYGAGRPDRVRRTFYIVVAWCTAISVIGWLGGQFVPDYIAMAFTVDLDLIESVNRYLPLSLTCFFVVGLQVVATTFFQSIGQAGRSMFMSLSRQVIFLIPLLLILPHFFEIEGVWASFAVSDIIATVVAFVLLYYPPSPLRTDCRPRLEPDETY